MLFGAAGVAASSSAATSSAFAANCECGQTCQFLTVHLQYKLANSSSEQLAGKRPAGKL